MTGSGQRRSLWVTAALLPLALVAGCSSDGGGSVTPTDAPTLSGDVVPSPDAAPAAAQTTMPAGATELGLGSMTIGPAEKGGVWPDDLVPSLDDAFVVPNDKSSDGPYLLGATFSVDPATNADYLEGTQTHMYCEKPNIDTVLVEGGGLSYIAFDGTPHGSMEPEAPGWAFFSVIGSECPTPYVLLEFHSFDDAGTSTTGWMGWQLG